MRPLVLVLAASLLTSCAVRQRPSTNWKLDGHLLVPPTQAGSANPELRNARKPGKADAACGVASPQVRLEWHGRTAILHCTPVEDAVEVTLKRRDHTTAIGNVNQDFDWWTAFNDRLKQREIEGCLASGEAAKLSEWILDSLPMPSQAAWQLRYGNIDQTGFVDLKENFGLKWMVPVASATGATAYETISYVPLQRGNGRLRLVQRSAELNHGGKVSRLSRTSSHPITLPSSARYVRYFFRTWRVSGARRIALLAVSRPELLDLFTKSFEADPEGFCAGLSAAEASCIAVPNDSVLLPEMIVEVNGSTVPVPVGGTLGDALGAAKVQVSDGDLHTMTVLRPWAGQMVPVEFNRNSRDILRLVAIGGEVIHLATRD